MSVAKTWRLAGAPPVGVSTSAVPMVSPAANTGPRPSTVMRPSSFTSACNSAMTHRWAGCHPRTMLRGTTFAVAAVPGAFETGSTPIPPSNLTSVSSARASDNTSASETTVSSVTILMMYLLVTVRFAWTSSDGLERRRIENHHLILVLCEFVTRILYAGTWWISSFTLVMGCCYKPIRVSCGVHEKSDKLTAVVDAVDCSGTDPLRIIDRLEESVVADEPVSENCSVHVGSNHVVLIVQAECLGEGGPWKIESEESPLDQQKTMVLASV